MAISYILFIFGQCFPKHKQILRAKFENSFFKGLINMNYD